MITRKLSRPLDEFDPNVVGCADPAKPRAIGQLVRTVDQGCSDRSESFDFGVDVFNVKPEVFKADIRARIAFGQCLAIERARNVYRDAVGRAAFKNRSPVCRVESSTISNPKLSTHHSAAFLGSLDFRWMWFRLYMLRP